MLHSGGALGSDSYFDHICQKYDIPRRHYYYGKKTPLGNSVISKEEFEQGWQAVLRANQKLKRQPWKFRELLARNFSIVSNSEVIYAISTLKSEDEVEGGSGWTVQMAIDVGKPVYVFDQEKEQWYEWKEKFILCEKPVLCKNFGGIGTRELNEKGKKAIESLFQ